MGERDEGRRKRKEMVAVECSPIVKRVCCVCPFGRLAVAEWSLTRVIPQWAVNRAARFHQVLSSRLGMQPLLMVNSRFRHRRKEFTYFFPNGRSNLIVGWAHACLFMCLFMYLLISLFIYQSVCLGLLAHSLQSLLCMYMHACSGSEQWIFGQ